MSNLFHKCNGCRYKGEHQEMGFASMGVCTRTTNLIEAEKNYKAEKCPYKKTNFDKIREMNADELADFLSKTSVATAIKLNGTYTVREKGFITKWLESEAEK